jgi:hypothetical protein
LKNARSNTDFATLEHVSFTISKLNQDASGKKTVNRTYWSIRKKINWPDENSSNLMLKDSKVTEKSIRCDKGNEREPVEKFTQLRLFPPSSE